jgi:hypothetical protein
MFRRNRDELGGQPKTIAVVDIDAQQYVEPTDRTPLKPRWNSLIIYFKP